jgi:hypothetical protein
MLSIMDLSKKRFTLYQVPIFSNAVGNFFDEIQRQDNLFNFQEYRLGADNYYDTFWLKAQ